ncbi:MAG: hypothetical protein H6R05_950 [Burkholderiaceae bacterium]|nr:hypothetical protein [Burkholderiaceae bacterium]
MNTKKWTVWGKRVALLSAAFALFGCVEIKGQADVDAKGHVKVVTTYDFSKVFNNIKNQNPALSDRMEGFDCKIFVSNSPNFKCEDEGLLKYKMSDELDKPIGVSVNEATQELSFDAVKFFAEVTDLKSMVQRNAEQSSLIAAGVPTLLPLQSARREMYAKEGLSIVLKVNFANEVVSVDGQPVKNMGKEMTINFMDIADKPSYVIVTKKTATSGGTWLFVILVLALLALAVWFLWRKKNGGTTPPSASVPPVAPTSPTVTNEQGEHEMNASATAVPDEMVPTHKPSRGERFAQAISAAAVGVGSSAVGGGANHTVEEVLAHEEAIMDEPHHQPSKDEGEEDKRGM